MKARRRQGLAWGLTTCALLLVFVGWPALDLWVSGLFYDPDQGFAINRLDAVQNFHHAVPLVGRGLLVVALGAWWLGGRRKAPLLQRWWKPAAALALCMVFGLGALVHEVFKDHWGRARPVQVQAFGGTATFTPPWQPSDQCDQNCSFVSGHAATGFVLMAVGTLGTVRRRRWWWTMGTLAGLALGALRIAQGGHFFSDILFAWVMMWGVSLVIRDAWLRARLRRGHLARLNRPRDRHQELNS